MSTFSKQFSRKQFGFTLIELLVVMSIIGILATIGLGSYGTAMSRARDASRKSDLANMARALELYYNDNKKYPTYLASGNFRNEAGENILWGGTWPGYMEKVPQDPKFSYYYRHETVGSARQGYRLFARLENTNDAKVPHIDNSPAHYEYVPDNPGATRCGGSGCNYQITSSNLAVPTAGAGEIVVDP